MELLMFYFKFNLAAVIFVAAILSVSSVLYFDLDVRWAIPGMAWLIVVAFAYGKE